MTEKKHILVVEDEVDLANLVKDYLQASEFTAEIFHSGIAVTDYVKAHTVDLILLDIQLPGKNGLDLCREIREFSNVPIFFITARIEEVDRLLGLELGADDYICKPFSPREVVARAKSLFRRLSPPATQDLDIQLDEERLILNLNGHKIELTKVEAALFNLLFASPGKIYSRSKIVDSIYSDYRIVSDRTVDSHIKKLRKKIAAVFDEKELIISIYGAGYKFEPTDKER